MESVLGVDGCRGGWVAARLFQHPLNFSLYLYPTFAELLALHLEADFIAVDIPIGLSECFAPRACDVEARYLLGARRSSVFPAPDRRLLACSDYKEACDFSERHSGKRISLQSFHISPKVCEVDAVMTPGLQTRVFEVHPELAFMEANERQALMHGKKSSDGYEERRSIVSRAFPGITIPQRSHIRKAIAGATAKDVQPDDILDAMIAAWTALRRVRGEHRSVPSGRESGPEYDGRGLRMEIVF